MSRLTAYWPWLCPFNTCCPGDGASTACVDQAAADALVEEAPAGDGWVHEIKYDGYRMHARIDGRDIKLLTRTDLDWSVGA